MKTRSHFNKALLGAISLILAFTIPGVIQAGNFNSTMPTVIENVVYKIIPI